VPAGTAPPACEGSQLNVPVKICWATPPAMKREIQTDSPLRDDLIHQEHEIRSGEELDDDQDLGQERPVTDEMTPNRNEPVQRADESRGRGEESEDLRTASTKIIRMTRNFWSPGTRSCPRRPGGPGDDLRAREELHDDRRRDDRPDPRCMSEPWAPARIAWMAEK